MFFIVSPIAYFYISKTQTDKRTDYPGREIAQNVQEQWNDKRGDKIIIAFGNEWEAGNLSYHLKDRPIWYSDKLSKKNEGKIALCGTKKINGISCLEYKMKQLIELK